MGDFHQGDERFSDISRGNQCYPICLAALLYTKVKEVSQWRSYDINEILLLGDEVYKMIRTEVHENHLRVEELPTCIELFDSTFSINQEPQILPHLNQTIHIPGTLSLHDAFSECFMKNKHALICIGCYASAVIQTETSFFLFDSHARNQQGLPDGDGKAIVLSFCNLDNLCAYIYKLNTALGYAETTILEITGINITQMRQQEKEIAT